VSQKASIVFAILAYVGIVYETFLTRSGVLADASVHSFVDLGLYGQLVVFMVAIVVIAAGLFLYRYKELPKQRKESKLLSREFITFSGSLLLFLLGLVIILGTSSPIIGKLFVEAPTPPEVSFYNDWTMPIAMLAAIFTVLGQYLFWKRQDAESLSADLLLPVALSCVITLISIIAGDVRNFYYMAYLLTAWFSVVGNAIIMIRLIKKKPMLIGGTLSHLGFATLLIGILASSAYDSHLLDEQTERYNEAIKAGTIKDDQGFPKTQPVNFLELKLNEPKIIGDKYRVTYEGYTLKDQVRPGQQAYRIKFEPLGDEEEEFILKPVVYPMLASSTPQNIEWSVEPDVRTGLFSDIYMYVSGSSYVQERNEEAEEKTGKNQKMEPVANTSQEDSTQVQKITIERGSTAPVGPYEIHLEGYEQEDDQMVKDSTLIAVRADITVTPRGSDSSVEMHPLFSIYQKDGKNWSFAPPMTIPGDKGSVQFSSINPETGEVELTIRGVEKKAEQPWVLLMAEEKPFVSIVWIGTFMLMADFSVSVFRHCD